MNFSPLSVRIGSEGAAPQLRIDVLDYEHPDTAEPADLDLMHCRVSAQAPPLDAPFEMAIALWEFFALRDYLQKIESGNGPSDSFMMAGGLLTLSFAPSKRGPVLCAVLLKTIDASHLRVEYLITLEPQDIARTLFDISQLKVHSQR